MTPHENAAVARASAEISPSRWELGEVDAAIERGVGFLRQQQLPSGAWMAMEDFEPRTSAIHLVTLGFIERVPLVEARGYARFLCTLQREDGSFPPHPCAADGDLAATALVYAALHVADLEEQLPVRARALAYVNAGGGFTALLDKLRREGDVTALYLAMAGLVDCFALPDPHLSFMLSPRLLDAMLKKVHGGIVQGAIFVAAVTRCLRERQRPSSAARRWLYEREAEACIEFMESWLNPNGNNNGTTVQTDLAIATLVALGRSPESRSVYSALSWFGKHKLWDQRGLHLRAFTNENWVTAFAVRALLHADVCPNDAAIVDGIDYLCWSQSRLPMPEVNLRGQDAHRTGGWGFEEDNLILPDTDDTGIVLSALGRSLDRRRSKPLEGARRQRVQDAVDLGLANLLDMQSDDGGWAGFVKNLGSKGPGPLFDKPVGMPASLAEAVRLFVQPPLELAEPPVEGLTGRVLQGLGANGFGPASPEVQRAARFLEQRQLPDGSFWARWIVGYVAATASVVSGLADCGWDMAAPWLRRALDWLLARQNPDGGWGETPAAYERPHAGSISPSMPPLTGIALIALVDAGWGDHPAAERAASYLIATQNSAGTWTSNGWLQIYQPHAGYYFFEGDAWYRPVEALAKLRAFRRRQASPTAGLVLAPRCSTVEVPQQLARPWRPAELRKLRALGDPVADEVIRRIFAAGHQDLLRQLMASVRTSDGPLPSNLPEPARAFFAESGALPVWASPEQLLRGQRLFTRHGWLMAAGFFFSSLPQAYAAAHGAQVLVQTQGMTRHVRHRILETAQFVFDVCGELSLVRGGRGVRSAQKVRLMHAAVRHFIHAKGNWSSSELGVPINQEDAAATLMLFSVVLLDTLEKAGVAVSRADQEAFLHLWRVVGHLLGVMPCLIPTDVADGRALMQAFRADQWAPSAQGQLLARDLVACIKTYLPGPIADGMPEALIRFFTPEPASAILGVGEATALDVLVGAGTRLGAGLTRTSEAQTRVRLIAHDLMVGIINVQRAGNLAGFRIPAGLVRDWSLED